MHRFTTLLPTIFAATAALACSSSKPAASTGTGGSSAAGSGGGGSAPTGPAAWNRPVTPPADETAATTRLACGYKAGSLPAETQGASYPSGTAIPINHILVLMQENRSFDHYFSQLPAYGQPDVEVTPAGYTNPDGMGGTVAPFHNTAAQYCFADTDHEWAGSHQEYDNGLMDGFFLANDNYGTAPPHPPAGSSPLSGARALGYYDSTDIPFYYWLANEFAIADHYHCSLLGPTWPNRMYLYAASSRGVTSSTFASFEDQAGACMTDADCPGGAAGSCVNQTSCKGTCKVDSDCGLDAQAGACDVAGGGDCQPVGRTIFDYMEQRQLDWKVYTNGTPGYGILIQQFLAYHTQHQFTLTQFYADAASGALPDVAFVDPADLSNEGYDGDDEHPPASPQVGQLFVAQVVQAVTQSPAWSTSALFITYDEHGGLFDHVVPPPACIPDDFAPILASTDPPGQFNQYGVRVPMMVVSPYAKAHYVGHDVYDHTSIDRFIEARFVIPAITNRDANALAPWDMFDFTSPPHATPPTVTLPTVDQTILSACGQVWNP